MPGRPRDPELERRLLAAGWSLLTEGGYAALTFAQVAAAGGAHRSDVYRRWPSKAQFVTQVLAAHLPPVTPFDTGSLRGDVAAYLERLAESWAAPWIDALVGLIADLRHDPDAELAFRVMAEGRGRPMRDALARAVERGELGRAPDLRVVGDFLEGPLMHRRLIALLPLTPEYLDSVAAAAHGLLLGATTGATA